MSWEAAARLQQGITEPIQGELPKELAYSGIAKGFDVFQILNEASPSSSTSEHKQQHNFQAYLCEFWIWMQGISPREKKDRFSMGAAQAELQLLIPEQQQPHRPCQPPRAPPLILSPKLPRVI